MRTGRRRWGLPFVLAAVAVVLGSCAGPGSPVATRRNPPPTTVPPTTVPPTTVPPTTVPLLSLGSAGPAVLALQQRLTALHYWLGTPNGQFGDSTQQAVYAFQKVAGLTADGVVGPATERALVAGAEPRPLSTGGAEIEVDLGLGVLMFVDGGRLQWALNTSTGGGYAYVQDGTTAVADTPTGRFQIFRQVDGMVVDSLGELWRPKFFDAGFAIHGDSYVPPVPVSHGCVRVSDEAIDWIWSSDLAPIGTAVWIY